MPDLYASVSPQRGRSDDLATEDLDAVSETLAAFADLPPLTMRVETDTDRDFLRALYRSTREAELDQVGWPEVQRQAFVEQQFSAQHTQYRAHYQGAALLVIEQAEQRIGRFYVHRTRSELRLMDIILMPDTRGRGLGSRIIDRLLDWGDRLGLPVTLHVEPFNPAQRLYLRRSFQTLEQRGVYHFMQRLPASRLPD